MAKRRRRRGFAETPQAGGEQAAGPGSPAEAAVEAPERPQSAKDYLKLPYKISVRAEEQNGGWTASVEELPGCDAHGDTPEHATRQLRAAMERWVTEALERGDQIPQPRSWGGHSGRLLLRMPQSLHAELAHAADGEGISLNQFITTALASAVGWRNHSAPDATRRGSTGDAEKTSGAAAAPPRRKSRGRDALLATNLIVLLVLAALAVVLVVIAWQQT
jgi:predicted RNase H-like HicB family nuclease